MRGVLLGLLLAPALALAAGGVARFQAYLRDTQTARADFEQRVYDRDKKLVQQSKGSFAFHAPRALPLDLRAALPAAHRRRRQARVDP